MKFVDLHADTASLLYEEGEGATLTKNDYCIDVEKMMKADTVAQVMAMFYNLSKVKYNYRELYSVYINMIRKTIKKVEEVPALSVIKSFEDLIKNESEGRISIIFAVEDGGIIDEDINRISELYDMGVRIITLTWNYNNCIGFPNNYFNFRSKGLTEFGKEVVRKMNEKGIVIDVSHLSDEGFYDVAEMSRLPFMASHSNARAISKNPRNLKDDMIKIIANKGGVIGINFYNDFVSDDKTASLEAITRHISHMKNIGGIDCIAIGTDFDGFEVPKESMPVKDTSEMWKLADYLWKNGFNSEEIEKIFHKNALRVLRDNLI